MTPAAQEWFDKGQNDFTTVHWLLQAPNPDWDAICFHAQQCAEKMLKALLTDRGSSFAKTHDLRVVAALAVSAEPRWMTAQADLLTLQPGAILFRYPGAHASAQDASDFVAACTRVRASLLPFL
jgi:HEPN domain-containing protein